jgi:hypothetical protein
VGPTPTSRVDTRPTPATTAPGRLAASCRHAKPCGWHAKPHARVRRSHTARTLLLAQQDAPRPQWRNTPRSCLSPITVQGRTDSRAHVPADSRRSVPLTATLRSTCKLPHTHRAPSRSLPRRTTWLSASDVLPPPKTHCRWTQQHTHTVTQLHRREPLLPLPPLPPPPFPVLTHTVTQLHRREPLLLPPPPLPPPLPPAPCRRACGAASAASGRAPGCSSAP